MKEVNKIRKQKLEAEIRYYENAIEVWIRNATLDEEFGLSGIFNTKHKGFTPVNVGSEILNLQNLDFNIEHKIFNEESEMLKQYN